MTYQQHSTSTMCVTLKKVRNYCRLSWIGIFAVILALTALETADCMASNAVDNRSFAQSELVNTTEQNFLGDPFIWEWELEKNRDIDGDGFIGPPPPSFS